MQVCFNNSTWSITYLMLFHIIYRHKVKWSYKCIRQEANHGNGVIVSKVGSGILTYTFDAIGHYLQDGKLHDTGHIIIKSTSGNLVSFSDKIGLYKDWYDTSGNGMTTMWFWKG